MTNLHNTTLYVGVTNNLVRRVEEHKHGQGSKFTRMYKLKKLVYYEVFRDISHAIAREKQLKGGSRIQKLRLIDGLNPEWCGLALDFDLM